MVPWSKLDRPLILASQSPRRKQILCTMGLEFDIASPQIADEAAFIDSRDFDASVRRLAEAKAMSVAAHHPSALIIGADTIVIREGVALGKPTGRDDAAGMLGRLSNAVHDVCSGVAVVCRDAGFSESVADRTAVHFREIGEDEIAGYLATGEYRDKAGAYAIQGRAMVFVTAIHGCYYNVVGLPVQATLGLLRTYSFRRGIR